MCTNMENKNYIKIFGTTQNTFFIYGHAFRNGGKKNAVASKSQLESQDSCPKMLNL